MWYFQTINHKWYKSAIFVSHDDIMMWTHFQHYWPFVLGIHQLLVDSQHKGPIKQSSDGFFVVNLDQL